MSIIMKSYRSLPVTCCNGSTPFASLTSGMKLRSGSGGDGKIALPDDDDEVPTKGLSIVLVGVGCE